MTRTTDSYPADRHTVSVSEPLVEVHVPLVPVEGAAEGEYSYPYLEAIEDVLFELDGQGRGEMWDDGEEFDDEYLFFISHASEEALLTLARELRALPGVPEQTYAVVSTTDAAEWGVGRRVDLSD